MRTLADVLDGLAALFALAAVAFFFITIGTLGMGPVFAQNALFCLLLAVVPYCLAGAVHRIIARSS